MNRATASSRMIGVNRRMPYYRTFPVRCQSENPGGRGAL
jgi:hypothetical protein